MRGPFIRWITTKLFFWCFNKQEEKDFGDECLGLRVENFAPAYDEYECEEDYFDEWESDEYEEDDYDEYESNEFEEDDYDEYEDEDYEGGEGGCYCTTCGRGCQEDPCNCHDIGCICPENYSDDDFQEEIPPPFDPPSI